MAQQIRASMVEILPVIETRLQAVTGLPVERVRPWIGEDSPHIQADQDLVLRLRGFTPTQSWQEGGGRYTTQIEERLEISIRTRLILDDPGTSRSWLYGGTDGVGTNGHLPLRNLVMSALQGFVPTDGDHNALVDMELQLVPSQAPKADNPRSPTNWGEERLTFLVKYTQSLDLTLSVVP